MEQFSTNQISLQKANKFTLIKKNIIQLSDSPSQKILKKYKTISILINRPILQKKLKLYNDKYHIKNQLDQIGKEDSIFKNDKLITNIKLETLDDISVKDIMDETIEKKENDINIKKYASPNKNTKRCLTPFNKTTNKRNLKNNYNKKQENNINKLTFDLNCNKIPQQPNINSIKSPNNKIIKKKLIRKTNQKNLKLFINKPQIKQTKNNELNQLNNLFMTPINIKNKRSKKIYNSSFTKFNDSYDNSNDSLCLTSVSKIVSKTYNKTKSSSINKKSANMHFPNKSNIKNKDKLLVELKKLFTDKLTLNDDTYLNMTDLDKKNCINFLLDSLKEMIVINKITQSKNDEFKEINKTKEKQIQNNKNIIKELKKDIMKLNKIIKTNILVNRKLSQKVDNLKIQLEKEKNKNKNKAIVSKSVNIVENKISLNDKIKNRNKVNGINISDTKRKLMNKSMDRLRKNNIKLEEKNYKCDKDTQVKEEEINNSKNKNTKDEDKNIINRENNSNKDLLLEKNLIKEKKHLRSNSDCTNFSDANNAIVE